MKVSDCCGAAADCEGMEESGLCPECKEPCEFNEYCEPAALFIMTEPRAREILGSTIQSDGTLFNQGQYIAWPDAAGPEHVCLDDRFTADELEAIAFWMRGCGGGK